MYNLPTAGPSFLVHLLVLVAAVIAWPFVQLINLAKKSN